MPLIIPKTLPAYDALYQENIFVMHRERAAAQHIRPLEILILNLMPTKITTETQIARLLANSPLQVHMTLLQTASHSATHVSAAHLEASHSTIMPRHSDHGVQRNQRLLHPPRLLGRPGCPLLSLRGEKGAAGPENVRHLRAPGHPARQPPGPGL